MLPFVVYSVKGGAAVGKFVVWKYKIVFGTFCQRFLYVSETYRIKTFVYIEALFRQQIIGKLVTSERSTLGEVTVVESGAHEQSVVDVKVVEIGADKVGIAVRILATVGMEVPRGASVAQTQV